MTETMDAEGARALDDFVCFALYRASLATTRAYREVLAPWDLTYPQYLALVVLATGSRRVGDLAGELGLDSGTLSPLVRRLEQRGLVQRERDCDDERVVTVSLTVAGRETRDALSDAVGCLVPALTGSGTPPRELLSSLTHLAADMDAIAHAAH